MTTEKWTDEDLRRAVDEISEQRDEWEQAINRGIDEGADSAPLTRLERAAIEMLVGFTVADPGELELEGVTAPEFAARQVTADPLMRKVAVALFLELGVNSQSIPDGILGRHLDQAIDQLLPYAKNSPNLGKLGAELFDEDR